MTIWPGRISPLQLNGARDWADAAFCRRHALAALPVLPQRLALYLKSPLTKNSQLPAGLRAGTTGLALQQRCADVSPLSPAKKQSKARDTGGVTR